MPRCWRCERYAMLYHDPMMPSADAIGLCRPCCIARYLLAAEYARRQR